MNFRLFYFVGAGEMVLIFDADDGRLSLGFTRVQEQDDYEDLRECEKRVLLPRRLNLFGRNAAR